jgi:hypothetical protein
MSALQSEIVELQQQAAQASQTHAEQLASLAKEVRNYMF